MLQITLYILKGLYLVIYMYMQVHIDTVTTEQIRHEFEGECGGA